MKFKARRFYRSKRDFTEFHFGLKQIACPRCRRIGRLILHGYLYGYDEKTYGKRVVRGRRIFCSNRFKRGGCGRTFSVLKSTILKGFNISAQGLWQFLKNISKGINKTQSFNKLSLPFSPTTVYRLYTRFKQSQSRIRVNLSRTFRLAKPYENGSATVQTILDIKSAFRRHPCPVSAYQEILQRPFL